MMIANSFTSLGSGQFWCQMSYENIFHFQNIRILEMKTCISPTGGKQTQEP